ncbi:MerR family transcriptional regulator [Pseudonocardia endophytica]|uniref:DNA-binding transcriptional MerR regulator n=1 Tax=Pseudonocardia endophytica TaxID=401976 RepID=A0A4R1I500_PSEEN|nr:MerR family transcriptional regulator [Pseudonocardia endophytica]TCK27679.1 DNA-binding transcriptional MerR regulator [Pseudonocardia endophytica]
MTEQSRRWRVGALAASSGLSQRTLRYWDSIGLLSPSARTDGGHREYDSDDLLRLYRILGLRSLGLTLDSIATCLDGGADTRRIVSDQLADVDRRLTDLSTLRDRLVQVERSLDEQSAVTADVLLAAVRAQHGPDGSVLGEHLDPDQIDAVGAAVRAAGPAAHYMLEIEWPQLYRRADALLTAGARPDDPAVRRLVGRLDELGARFSGGDPDVGRRIGDAYREDPAAISGVSDPPADRWRAVADFIELARTAGAARTRGAGSTPQAEGGRP